MSVLITYDDWCINPLDYYGWTLVALPLNLAFIGRSGNKSVGRDEPDGAATQRLSWILTNCNSRVYPNTIWDYFFEDPNEAIMFRLTFT